MTKFQKDLEKLDIALDFQSAEDGFALHIKDKDYNYSIIVNDERFYESGDFTVDFDKEYESNPEIIDKIQERSVEILSMVIKSVLDEKQA